MHGNSNIKKRQNVLYTHVRFAAIRRKFSKILSIVHSHTWASYVLAQAEEGSVVQATTQEKFGGVWWHRNCAYDLILITSDNI